MDPLPQYYLAFEHRWPRARVRLLTVVQVVQNPGICGLVCTWEADSSRCFACAAGDNVQLGTLLDHVR
jgi:hypothetical protein